MKSRLYMLALVCFPVVAFAHPLENAIRSLSQTAVNLDAAKGASQSQALLQQIAIVKGKVADAWGTAITAPIAVSDAQLNNLGYPLVQDAWNKTWELKPNDNAKQMDQDAYAFKSDRWQALDRIADQQIQDLNAIHALLGASDVIGGIPDQQIQSVHWATDLTRVSGGLVLIKQQAEMTLSCMDYFKHAFTDAGLVPVRQSGDSFSWSPDILWQTYHIHALTEAAPDVQSKIASQLSALREKAERYSYSCVPIEEVAFIADQMKSLKGSQK